MRYCEHYLQRDCVDWFKSTFPDMAVLFFAVPNGFKRSVSQTQWLKDEGLTKGIADTILLVPNKLHHCLLIEFKDVKGRQSQEQKEFQSKATEKGFLYVVCKHKADFKELINNYLEDKI